ncbi:MAG: hypothetical protein K2J67_11675 [Lachnospiraceae bacterium]|nr:hypothetical protein [Lachnospiraceae bacterium]
MTINEYAASSLFHFRLNTASLFRQQAAYANKTAQASTKQYHPFVTFPKINNTMPKRKKKQESATYMNLTALSLSPFRIIKGIIILSPIIIGI